jgi:FtsP/CotA-like multicopper oxidase with cupredoxin domain
VQVSTVRIGPAERVDIIIDFSQFAGKSIFLENRLLQINGQGPVPPLGFTPGQVECSDTNGNVLSDIRPAGQGDLLLRFDVSSKPVKDNSLPPSKQTFYSLPSTNATPRITRTFKFDRLNGQWSVNGQFVDTDRSAFRFTVQQNSVENWLLTNLTGDWTHPIHIHLEEHQILSRNRMPNTLAAENSRKDVTQLHPNERVLLFFRFRDWLGRYPIHCHNVVHEDHAMMALWHVEPTGDNVFVP